MWHSPEIKFLQSIFPSIAIEVLANKYWDNKNDLEKTVNDILGKEVSKGSAMRRQ